MNRLVKYIRRQDSGWKQAFGYSGETSINLSNEIFDFLSFGLVDGGEECGVTFKIFREDYLNALTYIQSQLPLYRSTSRTCDKILDGNSIFVKLNDSIYRMFGDNDSIDYTVVLYCRKDGRIYLKELKQKGFSIRDFLVEYGSAIVFEQIEAGISLRIVSAVYEGELE